VLYLLVVPDRPHAPTVNIDNTTARTLDDSLPGQLVNPRSRPSCGRRLEFVLGLTWITICRCCGPG
jgi:hypothetical protein